MKVFLFSLSGNAGGIGAQTSRPFHRGKRTASHFLSEQTSAPEPGGIRHSTNIIIMKSFIKLFAIALAAMTMTACTETVEETFVYSVGNATLLTNSDLLSVMSYAESKVKMSAESVMTFTGTQADADKQAKAEFANRLKAIDEQEFCAMIAEGDYYDFILYRASKEPGKSEEIDRKHYNGTK